MPKLVLNLYHSIEKISTLLLQVSCWWATDLKSDNFTIIVLWSADPWLLDQVEFKTNQFVKLDHSTFGEYDPWMGAGCR